MAQWVALDTMPTPRQILTVIDRLERVEAALVAVADLKRYDPNKDRSNAGRSVTLNVPAEVMQAVDECLGRK